MEVEYDDEAIPDEFRCPITREIMVDPVIAKDGRSYERVAITTWLRNHKASPMTRQPLDAEQLTPNLSLRHCIENWRQKYFLSIHTGDLKVSRGYN